MRRERPPANPTITGPELLARRKALEMTQTELGDALGVHWNTLSRWEREVLVIENPVILARALRDLERQMDKRRKRSPRPASGRVVRIPRKARRRVAGGVA